MANMPLNAIMRQVTHCSEILPIQRLAAERYAPL